MIQCHADVLADPQTYAAQARAAAFLDVDTPAGTFHGIAAPPSAAFTDWLSSHGLTVTQTCLRRSPFGQREPHYVHTDTDMGDWMAVLYLVPEPPGLDGTFFWVDGRPDILIRSRFNAAVVFTTDRPHSRAIFENYGSGETARLIQIAWGTGLWQ